MAANIGPNVTSVRTVYSYTNVGTSTPVVVIPSTMHQSTVISIFDSSAQTMALIVTDLGGNIDTLIIPPGGLGFKFAINKGSKVALLALSGSATTGENDINIS
jgi:hypothetical protein